MQSANSVPARLGYVIVYVPNVESAITFYTEAFGLERKFVTPEGDYAELITGQTTLAFASEELANANLVAAGGFAPLDRTERPPGVALTLLTSDVNAVVERAVRCGASPYAPTTAKPWGQTVAYIRDPHGVLLEIATPMSS